MDLDRLKEKSIIVCGIVRDAANGLKGNIPVIDEVCSWFGDYKIVFYENDSRDGTDELLQQWSKRDPERIHILSECSGASSPVPTKGESGFNPFFSARRIAKMVELRNRYMDYIDTQGWGADYLMVVDMDVRQICVEGIRSSFLADKDWDVVTAFGYSTSPQLKRRYHDTYALTEYGMENVPQTEKMVKDLAAKYELLLRGKDWVRVFSAFGGMAIYCFEKVKGLRYRLIPNKDTRVEVHCEHYSLYSQMAESGETKVYINPLMKIEYQRLSWRIIWRSFKRMISDCIATKHTYGTTKTEV